MPHWFPRSKGSPKKAHLDHNHALEVDPVVNAAYYPNYRVYRKQPPSTLDIGCITHVFYAFAWPTEDGNIISSDAHADEVIDCDGGKGALTSLLNLRKQHIHLKVLLSIGGGGAGSRHFATIAKSPPLLQKFVEHVRVWVNLHQFDGIDIDWEHPQTSSEGQAYVSLLSTLRHALPAPTYLLTSAIPSAAWALRHIPLSAATAHLDYINLMAYDFTGPWTAVSGHHAQMYTPRELASSIDGQSCASAVAYLSAEGVHAKKILLGIPAYGRSFLGTSASRTAYSGCGGDEGAYEYRDLPRPGTTEVVDEVGAAYCVGDGNFVSYDNVKTTQMKAAFVIKEKLGGLFYWNAAGDKVGEESLVRNGWLALNTG